MSPNLFKNVAFQDLTPAGVVTVGFGTTVAMWAVGYFCRLPAILLPSPLVLVLLLGCLFGGGYVLGRASGSGWSIGAAAGLITGVLNLLILGSLLGGDDPNRVVPSALWWLPGSILVSAALAGVGAAVGSRQATTSAGRVNWLSAFAWVAVAATALLLAAGGLVTSAEAGLAVDDWPTSFGYNMFLYPLSKMTGGVYYEHAHRLLGALVGLTTVVLALMVQSTASPRWVRVWAWLAVPTVIVQGILGGIRVTERNLALAMVHGVLAQIFFAGLVALAVFTSDRWSRETEPLRRATGATDRKIRVGAVVRRSAGPVYWAASLGSEHRPASAATPGAGLGRRHLDAGSAGVRCAARYLGGRPRGIGARLGSEHRHRSPVVRCDRAGRHRGPRLLELQASRATELRESAALQ